ncbi:LOW QUALITY PROTEIN: C-type lectin domain family 4 member D-like [Penaeus monodon]|uniref:LOW QUALITY PROTEIN: C-type lectin domain family 4 member D-like n=1 Tax=Penaeus monodon TaxID=6687 RepID=UPI0018A76201|nr:LOW QUALITY PROTEIN: C-type lectin domain family 4 member D-like [Penaeus monodon]
MRGTAAALCLLAVLTTRAPGATAAPRCPADFVSLDGRCVHIYTENYAGNAPAMTWPSAKALCAAKATDGWSTELATVNEAFLTKFTAHVVSEIPGMTGYIFWTGGSKVNGVWQWTDTAPIDPLAYIWYMSSPNPDSTGVYGMLVPSGANNRFYMLEYDESNVGPSFICEAKALVA